MSQLISLEKVSLAYGLEPLLDQVKWQVGERERVCLIGRNGAGKSSLLKLIEGSEQPDSGTIWRKPGLRIARLMQTLPQQTACTVFDFVAGGLADIGALLAAYHAVTHRLSHTSTPQDLRELERLQRAIDAQQGWRYEQEINTTLTRLALNPDALLTALSGGWQRRAALARALVSSPDLLLLDEPTNHLDIEAIEWLENQLIALNKSLIFVTHDRSFLQRLATSIVELDRGQLTVYACDYQTYLMRKEDMLHAEAKQQADFDKKLMQEEKWIRQGIKARRTRNEGRVRALKAMREERRKRRAVVGQVVLSMQEASASGQLVVEAKHITQTYEGRDIIRDFSIRIERCDRIGLIGPNGAGKSTLLNILLGHLQPQQGSVTQGTKLEVAYFDQFRTALDLEKTVAQNVVEGSDMVDIQGTKRHIISYLGDFLFTPQRAMTPVKALSGGECNRLLLARLFARPANLLVMDEPTNDLDIETLELLEELLIQYQGTLLIVSHDRVFLDNVVTSTLVFEGDGHLQEYVGGYHDALRQRQPQVVAPTKPSKVTEVPVTPSVSSSTRKMSYKEQQELYALPHRIEQLEAEQSQLQTQTAHADFYRQSPEMITQTLARLSQLTLELEEAYQRWEILEKMAGG